MDEKIAIFENCTYFCDTKPNYIYLTEYLQFFVFLK